MLVRAGMLPPLRILISFRIGCFFILGKLLFLVSDFACHHVAIWILWTFAQKDALCIYSLPSVYWSEALFRFLQLSHVNDLPSGQSASRTAPFTERQAISRFIFEMFLHETDRSIEVGPLSFEFTSPRSVLWFRVCITAMRSCFPQQFLRNVVLMLY